MKVDYIFDFASPNAYLAHKIIPILEESTGSSFEYVPCLLGGIFKLTNNRPPMIAFAEVKNKNEYMFIEMQRFMKKYSLNNFKMNSNFPLNTLNLMRGAIAAKLNDSQREYIDLIFKGVWEKDLKLDEPEVFANYLKENGLDPEFYIENIQKQEVKDILMENTSEAVEHGTFGIPTFKVDDQIFYGKDHMNFLEEYLLQKQK